MNSNYIAFMPIIIFAGVDVEAGFKLMGTISYPLRYLHIQNISDEPVIISIDGQYGHFIVDKQDEKDFYAQACKTPANNMSILKKNTKIYVKAENNIPKGGGIIISGYY